LLRYKNAWCFSPRDSEKKRRERQHEQRQTPLKYGNAPGTNRVRRPKRSAGDGYTNDSYRRAITRACALAFPAPEELPDEQKHQWNREHAWHPHQLRHTAATKIRQRFGIEAAQVVLGHSRADVTQIYAQKNAELGQQVAMAIG
jgi:integrase